MENLFDEQYKKWEKAYRKTIYICLREEEEIRIGTRSPGGDALLEEYGADGLCILTADNPGSDIMTTEENRKAFAELYMLLIKDGFDFLQGLNLDPEGLFPDEKSFWIPGMDVETGRRYGKQFGQNAFVYYRKGEPAHLKWCVLSF